MIKNSKKIEEKIQIGILKGTVAGMIHLHKEGIIHRDLAARNVLRKLWDFSSTHT